MANNQTQQSSRSAVSKAGGQKKKSNRAAQLKKRKALRRHRLLTFVLALALIAACVYLFARVFRDDFKLQNEKDPVATITLSGGERIVLELFPEAAPATVQNFITLANKGYYDGLSFHRVYAGERIQTGNGDEAAMIRGEFSLNGVENPLSHMRGTVSMARLTGYDTAASQFFICLGDQSYFDGAYAAFGRVVKGMEYVDQIASAPVDEDHQPLTDQIIRTIRADAKEFRYTPEP